MTLRRKPIGIMMILFVLMMAVVAGVGQPTYAPVNAQDGDAACGDLVRQAIREIGSSCRELGRNEACYGNTRVDADLTDATLAFDENGDIVGVTTLNRLVTQPANPDRGEWGIAVLDILADLPESGSDNVRLLMFGGVEVAPAAPAGIDPDQPTCALRNTRGQGVNLRVGPGLDFTIVDSLRPDQTTTAYGISTDGAWYRTARGWIAADFVADSCDEIDLLAIDDASEAYFAPLQAFTMQVGAGGSCEDAPDGLLIQAPTDQTANILINNVELRVGSTAIVTETEDGDLLIGNLEGDVTVTSNGNGQSLLPGQGTTVGQGAGNTDTTNPSDPFNLNDAIDDLPPDLLNSLPRPVEMPTFVPFNTGNTGNGNNGNGATGNGNTGTGGGGSGDGPGSWLGCGSCSTCGYPANECVTSPDGACLWDPATCRPSPSGPALIFSGPASVVCEAAFDIIPLILTYNNPDGSIIEDAGSGLYSEVTAIGPNQLQVTVFCPELGQLPAASTAIVYASNGESYQWTTQILAP